MHRYKEIHVHGCCGVHATTAPGMYDLGRRNAHRNTGQPLSLQCIEVLLGSLYPELRAEQSRETTTKSARRLIWGTWAEKLYPHHMKNRHVT